MKLKKRDKTYREIAKRIAEKYDVDPESVNELISMAYLHYQDIITGQKIKDIKEKEEYYDIKKHIPTTVIGSFWFSDKRFKRFNKNFESKGKYKI